MKKSILIIGVFIVVVFALIVLRQNPGTTGLLWRISNNGTWLLPLVLFSALLDSIHPCSFSILLLTVAFLFGMRMTRKKILAVGGAYIIGIFFAYFLIGLGILHILHLFNTPHFMGRLGAGLLVGFGILNVVNEFFPSFPIKLQLPHAAHAKMSILIDRASIPAAFGLGLLVGICQFPCMGGPYLMVIGLLHDAVTYLRGFAYILLYNLILVVPLGIVLLIASQEALVKKIQLWQRQERSTFRLSAGIIMIIFGLLILLL